MNELKEIELSTDNTYKKYHPYLYHLNKIEWFIFGSLTWDLESRRSLSNQAAWFRRKDFNLLIKQFLIIYKLRRRQLAFYQAQEFGKSIQPHYHFLIAKNGLEHLNAADCAQTLENLWKIGLQPYCSNRSGIGTAYVKPYDEAKEHPGVEYCLKREYNEFGKELEKDDFLSPRLMKIAGEIKSDINASEKPRRDELYLNLQPRRENWDDVTF